jgi:lipopolysaccharide/colanic/teichoic acid biosynthesis glycosyltransferase
MVILIGSRDARDKIRPRLEEVRSGSVLVAEFDAVSEAEFPGADGALTDVILSDADGYGAMWPEPLASLASRGIAVHQRVDALSTLIGLRSVREIGGVPFVVVRSGLLLSYQRRIKRWLDLVLVVVAAPVWLLALGLIAGYVRVVAGGGVLYRQRRVGLGGGEFTMLKFRTMRRDAEASTGPVLAARRDERVIPALRFLRRSRLDELPQLLNVLRGEMSLVGPRPERPELVARFSETIAGYGLRHQTPPGITGLAQLRGHYETDPEHKLGYDLQYQVTWSLLQDVQLVLLTPFTMVRWRGGRHRLPSSIGGAVEAGKQ